MRAAPRFAPQPPIPNPQSLILNANPPENRRRGSDHDDRETHGGVIKGVDLALEASKRAESRI